MINKRFKRKIHKRAKAVKSMVPDTVHEKAAQLNPLAEPEPTIIEEVPQITNETIAEHRENVLGGARKYIYPLQHSKHSIIKITATIMIFALIGFLIYCTIGMYRLYQYNTFLYRVTQVIPFPVAKTSGHYVSYNDYLFELRHFVHYYQSQQQSNFSSSDKDQLNQFKKQSLQIVVDNSYVKMLARQNHIGVSNKEVNNRIDELREQNRLGSNSKVFADVLHDYWGWSVDDFKRSLKQEILQEKVVAKLDSQATKRANDALAQIKSGADFAAVAKQVSDDPGAKANGGDYGFAVTKTNPNVPPQVTDVLFSLKPGQVSGVIDTGNTLEMVKVSQSSGQSVTAQHISIKLKDISTYLKPIEKQTPPHLYIHL